MRCVEDNVAGDHHHGHAHVVLLPRVQQPRTHQSLVSDLLPNDSDNGTSTAKGPRPGTWQGARRLGGHEAGVRGGCLGGKVKHQLLMRGGWPVGHHDEPEDDDDEE